MRIKEKARFVIGVIDVLGGIACLTACIYLHRGAKTALTFVPIICGVVSLKQSIRTKKQDEEEFIKIFTGADDSTRCCYSGVKCYADDCGICKERTNFFKEV